MLSPYCQDLLECSNLNTGTVPKLVPNLQDKTNYVVHYRNLKQYLALGMKLTKTHRVLVFLHSPWLKTYIKLHQSNVLDRDLKTANILVSNRHYCDKDSDEILACFNREPISPNAVVM